MARHLVRALVGRALRKPEAEPSGPIGGVVSVSAITSGSLSVPRTRSVRPPALLVVGVVSLLALAAALIALLGAGGDHR